MGAQIVFVSLFLGLIAGHQPVEVHVGAGVTAVRFMVDGNQSDLVHGEPWVGTVDLGTAFQPHEITAIALDRDGYEVARASQLVNLPRPVAELTIALHGEGEGTAAVLHWEHVLGAKPAGASITVDGRPIRTKADFHARLPAFDSRRPHVVAATMKFDDGAVAKREVVLAGSILSDSISTELTPVVVTGPEPGRRESFDRCFVLDGRPVGVRAIETPEADVFAVREPADDAVFRSLGSDIAARGMRDPMRFPLDRRTTMRFTWPVKHRVASEGHVPVDLFTSSPILTTADGGMQHFLLLPYATQDTVSVFAPVEPGVPRFFADAVAVAGLNAAAAGRRRAVLLVVDQSYSPGPPADMSHAQPSEVRRYLASIGVPLMVWSVDGPRPDLAASWGVVDDISTKAKFQAAVVQLRVKLAAQHIAWVAASPLTALEIQPDGHCPWTPLAQRL